MNTSVHYAHDSADVGHGTAENDRDADAAGKVSAAIRSRAVVATKLGGPEVLQVQPWDIAEPGPDRVRVRQQASAISYADLLVMQGVHPERTKPPFVPGWEAFGEIEAVGSDVDQFAVGDRVAGLSIHGGWAKHAIAPASWVVPVPAALEATSAVCLVMDYIVAYQMLTRSAQVRKGDTILVQGVGGGVGTALMQVARTLGVRVLGTDRENKREHIESQGGVLIDFENEDVVARCRELTSGRGVDAAFDGVGDTAMVSLRAVRKAGKLIWFGMINALSAGERDLLMTLKTAARLFPVFAQNLIPGGKRTTIYSIQLLARKHPEWYRADLAKLLQMLNNGEIAPQVAAVWNLDDVPRAVAQMASGSLPGKQVISLTAD